MIQSHSKTDRQRERERREEREEREREERERERKREKTDRERERERDVGSEFAWLSRETMCLHAKDCKGNLIMSLLPIQGRAVFRGTQIQTW